MCNIFVSIDFWIFDVLSFFRLLFDVTVGFILRDPSRVFSFFFQYCQLLFSYFFSVIWTRTTVFLPLFKAEWNLCHAPRTDFSRSLSLSNLLSHLCGVLDTSTGHQTFPRNVTDCGILINTKPPFHWGLPKRKQHHHVYHLLHVLVFVGLGHMLTVQLVNSFLLLIKIWKPSAVWCPCWKDFDFSKNSVTLGKKHPIWCGQHVQNTFEFFSCILRKFLWFCGDPSKKYFPQGNNRGAGGKWVGAGRGGICSEIQQWLQRFNPCIPCGYAHYLEKSAFLSSFSVTKPICLQLCGLSNVQC